MKALAALLLLVFVCDQAGAQQMRMGNVSQNLLGSVAQGTPTNTAIPLSIADAIDSALKYNLGTILGEQQTRIARAERLRVLSDLMPKVNADIQQSAQQINLAAFGFSGFPGVRPIVGPFSLVDLRARYSHRILDFKLLHDLRSASAEVKANKYAQADIRELVVLITTDLYLEAVAGASRVEAAQAQLRTYQAVFDRTTNLKNSGLVAGIDVLRAQVQLQAQQQRVLAEQNGVAKAKLNLARAIGLPQSQEFTQTNTFIKEAPPVPEFNQLMSSALDARSDYKRAMSLVRAADEDRKAAAARRKPSIVINGDYGDIGRTLGQSHGTFFAQATLRIPIYTGGRAQAEILESDAQFEERTAEVSNLRDRIEYEIRTATLDIRSTLEQVKVAQNAKDLAQQQFVQAQDRFVAGIANSLEIVQAQDAIATADENYISSLYSLNVAEAALARAIGSAETTIKSVFGGR